jgi:hypothetical protein
MHILAQTISSKRLVSPALFRRSLIPRL